MELKNKTYSKKFTAPNSAVAEQRGTIGTFYLPPNRSAKSFNDAHNYSTTEFSSQSFKDSRSVATTQNESSNKSASGASASASGGRPAYESNNAIPAREYVEQQRQFAEKGKSQKSLDRQNPPLTIDQVRELLNKNK